MATSYQDHILMNTCISYMYLVLCIMQIMCVYSVVVLCSLYYAPRENRHPNLYDIFIHEYNNIIVMVMQHCRFFVAFIRFFFYY